MKRKLVTALILTLLFSLILTSCGLTGIFGSTDNNTNNESEENGAGDNNTEGGENGGSTSGGNNSGDTGNGDNTPGDNGSTGEGGNAGDSTPTDCEHLRLATDAAREPSCAQVGLTEGLHCVDCGEILIPQEEIPALPHVETPSADVAPTCQANGSIGGTHCDVCGEVIVPGEVIPALPHTPVASPNVDATCSANGSIGGTHCDVCGEVIVPGEIVPALPHTEETVLGYASTCSRTGLTDGKRCTVCEAITVPQLPIDKISHTEIVTKAVMPTCQSVGYTEGRVCSVCNTVTLERVELPIGDHTPVRDKAVAPTCMDNGLTEGSHCSVCNQTLVAQTVISANGQHVYGEFATVTTSPSFTSSGSGKMTCTRCGHSESLTFSQLTAQTLTKDDIYSIDTDKYNPAYDGRWKVIDGNKDVSGIYDSGDWFGNIGDVLVLTLQQEMILTDFKVYTTGNYTTATVRVKDANGNVTSTKEITVNGYDLTFTIASGVKIKAYTIEIQIDSIKWNDPRTLKIGELEIKAAYQDTRIQHEHVYREFKETERVATCQLEGIDIYECYCGKEGRIETERGECEYTQLLSLTSVTCIAGGTATYECACGATKTYETEPLGHTFAKLISCTVTPTRVSEGSASYRCTRCSISEERTLARLPVEEIHYLRVDSIENGIVTLKLNIYGERPSFEVRYSTGVITDDNFESATRVLATADGSDLITLTFALNASLEEGYYVAVKPYCGDNYGKMATVRVGGNLQIPVDYDKAQIYHGEVLNSFRPMFDGDTSTVLETIFRDSGDTAELFGSYLRPIIDLEYMHYVTSVRLYFASAGKTATVRWSDTPVDFMADNSEWDGYVNITSGTGWSNAQINASARYIQVVFVDGHAPSEVEVYGYQCGDGDEIATEKRDTLPTIGEMMGMCGFVAGGNGHTPIDEVNCTTVLREYHNFGWSYDATKYGRNGATFFTSTWMGNFDYEYRTYKDAGMSVIPCIQWNLKKETISYKVGSDNQPIYSSGSLVRASFWERFNPYTYFVYADCMFAFSARYGSNSSPSLLESARLHCSDTPSVGQNTLQWIEMGNEPDGNWNGIHNYLSAYQTAAATSAAYDGHARTMRSKATGGYLLGGKNADPNIKLAMAGVSGISNEFITAMCYWMKANRADGDVAFDAFNVHNYMTKQIALPNGALTTVGISPEEADIVGTLSQLAEIRDKYYPEKELWVTEFGWDTNQSYATSTSSHAYADYTGRQVQAMWLTRTYLLLSACGVDKADMYMCHDTGYEETSVGKYGTAGVIAYEKDENGNDVKVKKDSYYYLYTLKNALGEYAFDSQIEAYDENVMIYRYVTEDGREAYAVWCKTSDGTRHDGYQLRINGDTAELIEAVYGDIDGERTDLTSDELSYVTIDVSENPVYVIVD